MFFNIIISHSFEVENCVYNYRFEIIMAYVKKVKGSGKLHSLDGECATKELAYSKKRALLMSDIICLLLNPLSVCCLPVCD